MLKLCILLLLQLAVVFSQQPVDQGAFIWQGFKYDWQRHMFGVIQTPHRLGSWANQLKNESFEFNTPAGSAYPDSFQAKADFFAHLTPGVNGDYADPESNYVALASKNNKRLQFTNHKLAFNFTDKSDYSNKKNPHAETLIKNSVKIEGLENGLVSREIFLKGFNIDMKCVSKNCNSEGVWPYKFLIDLQNCDNQEDSLSCDIVFELNRGWNMASFMDQFVRRDYNDQMYFEVEIQYVVVHTDKDCMTTFAQEVKADSNTHQPRVSIRKEHPYSDGTDFHVGMTGFGFELNKTNGHEIKSRYIEGLEFMIEDPRVEAGKFVYDVGMNHYDAKLGTYDADVSLYMKTKGIFFNADSTGNMPVMSTKADAKAKVCIDDKATLFFCKSHHRENSATNTVTMSYSGK